MACQFLLFLLFMACDFLLLLLTGAGEPNLMSGNTVHMWLCILRVQGLGCKQEASFCE